MKINPKQLAKILVDTTEKKTPEQVSEIVKEFVKFLDDQKLIDKWREIEQAIHKIWKEKYGASSIKILSAHELTAEAQKMLDSIAPGADIKANVDKKIIGGAIIRIDDTRIDGSIVGKLQSLKATLMK